MQTIEPDTKDWTWVLVRTCTECAYDANSVRREQLAPLLRTYVERWHGLLNAPGDLRSRRIPTMWSTLEYGCHVRDVLRVFDERLRLMLDTDDPSYPDWDQNATAIEDGYLEQDPLKVAEELRSIGGETADRYAALAGDQWERTGTRGDGARFTVASFGRYLLHDSVHHVWDMKGESWRLPPG